MKSTVLAAVAVCAAAIASAQPPDPPTPQQKAAWEAKRMDRLALLLDLNAAQKSEVQMILDTERSKAQAALAQLRSSGTRPTHDQIKALREQIKSDTDQQLSGVLSPLQVQKFNALHEGLGGRRFRHHRPGPPPPDSTPPGSATQN
jgi:Spy/CpxP family protein refolding chaperone